MLTRNTRSVSPTEAGERLLCSVGPRFEEIEHEIAALIALRENPAGSIRITAGEHPAVTVLQPALAKFLPGYPDIHVEIIVDYGLSDIVAEGYDAGVRLGEQIAKDMIALQIGPAMCMAAVGSPAYFAQNPRPETPQDLTQHNCINIRLPTYGGLFPREFEKGGRELKVRVEGQLVFNDITLRLNSALAGLGLTYLPEDLALEHIAAGRLIRVLEDWCEPFPGYHLHYPPPPFLAGLRAGGPCAALSRAVRPDLADAGLSPDSPRRTPSPSRRPLSPQALQRWRHASCPPWASRRASA